MSEGDRTEVNRLREEVENFRDEFIIPAVHELEDRVDALEAENETLRDKVEQQGARLEQLDTQLENLIGVDDPDLSTHDKRVRDVRAAMIRRAEARSDGGEGKIALYYAEVQDLLADHGHGDVHRQQAHRIMGDIKNVDGFTEGTKTSKHGNEVKAIRLDLDALPGYARRHNVTTPGDGGRAKTAGKYDQEHNQG